MADRFKAETPEALHIIDVDPDTLIKAARMMHERARSAHPGQEIILKFSARAAFRYDPQVSSASLERRPYGLPGTLISTKIERAFEEDVRNDELAMHAQVLS